MTTTRRTVNRAARIRVRATLDLARHAIDLLRNKEEALRREHARLEAHAHRTGQQWTARCHDATTWLLRARSLGAGTEIAAEIDPTSNPADIRIGWQTAMGVVYPGDVACTPGTTPVVTSTAAVIPTAAAYCDGLVAGAAYAAARAALHRVENELALTRRRRRAIEERLQPDLVAQLHRLDLDLDERDRDAAVRTQLATRRGRARP